MTNLTIHPATPSRWPDLERLFGPNGAYSGCWCMFLRIDSKTFDANCAGGGAANRDALKTLVEGGSRPGLLAYRQRQPVGWVAVAPRSEYGRVLRSPIHRPVDDAVGVYAISCFFVARGVRGEGIADALLEAAVDFARRRGARLLEAYPGETSGRQPAAQMWRGSVAQFERVGFEVVARRKPARPIMRLELS